MSSVSNSLVSPQLFKASETVLNHTNQACYPGILWLAQNCWEDALSWMKAVWELGDSKAQWGKPPCLWWHHLWQQPTQCLEQRMLWQIWYHTPVIYQWHTTSLRPGFWGLGLHMDHTQPPTRHMLQGSVCNSWHDCTWTVTFLFRPTTRSYTGLPPFLSPPSVHKGSCTFTIQSCWCNPILQPHVLYNIYLALWYNLAHSLVQYTSQSYSYDH